MSAENPESTRPHVSALMWEGVLGTPFQRRIEPPEIKKTRGRPRKNVITVEGKRSHKMSDSEPEIRNLLPSTNCKLIADFKEYVQEGMAPKIALEEVCKLYRVPYAQAFNLCVDEY